MGQAVDQYEVKAPAGDSGDFEVKAPATIPATAGEAKQLTVGPLDALAAWGASKFPHISPDDVQNNSELKKYDTFRNHPVAAPAVGRFAANAVNETARDILATPAAIVDWAWKNGIKGPWTPAQSAQRMQEDAAGGQKFDPKKPITSADVSDYAAEKTGQLATAVIEGKALGKGIEMVTEDRTPGALRRKAQKLMGAGERPVTAEIKAGAKKFGEEAVVAKSNNVALEEHRTRRREIEKRTEAKTAALAAKQQAIQTKAATENRARWNDLRTEMGDEHTTSAEPLQIAAEAAIQEADPATSSLFKRILKHEPGETSVTGELPGRPRDWQEYQERQDANPDADEVPPAMDEGGVTFGKLQRWRTFLNSKLYGGGRLEGGTYHAYKTMLRGIDSSMDHIAKKTGQTDALKAARGGHEHLMMTFSDSPNIPMTAAKQNLQRTNPEAFREQHDLEMEARVAHYDPTYAKDASSVRTDRRILKSFPSEEGLKDSLKAPPDFPTVGLDEARKAKLGGLEKRIEWIRHRGMWIATGAAFGGTLYGILEGSFSTATRAFIEGSTAAALAGRYVEFLEKPGIQEWLTRPDPMSLREWQKLKPEQQAVVSEALRPTVETARSKGIRVAPTVLVMAGLMAQPPQSAGEAKQQVQDIQQQLNAP